MTIAATGQIGELDGEQKQHWRVFSRGTTMLREALDQQLEEDSDLSLGEYEVLNRLVEAEGHALRMSDLATCLAHSRSRLSHTVARMERAGLVTRRRCNRDARGVWCAMTDQGLRAVQAAAPGHLAALRENLIDLLTSDQLAALGEAMTVVQDTIDARSHRT